MSFDPNAAARPGSGVYGLPHTPEQAKVVLVPVPFEATCSYGGGTADGPEAILEASKQVDLFDLETGKPYEAGIAMLPLPKQVREWSNRGRELAEPIIEAGGVADAKDLAEVNALCAQMNEWVYAECKRWMALGTRGGVVGGDHSTPYGCIRAHAEAHPGLGILHLDAHADLRDAYEGFTWSHASIMHNVIHRLPRVSRLVQVGIRDFSEGELEEIEASNGRIETFFDERMASEKADGMSWREICDNIVNRLPKQVYLSFDIDGLDPTLCPHTGTPVPGGLSFQEACQLIAAVARAGKHIVGFDLNEVAPGPDSEWDGNVAARLLYKMIGWSLRT